MHRFATTTAGQCLARRVPNASPCHPLPATHSCDGYYHCEGHTYGAWQGIWKVNSSIAMIVASVSSVEHNRTHQCYGVVLQIDHTAWHQPSWYQWLSLPSTFTERCLPSCMRWIMPIFTEGSNRQSESIWSKQGFVGLVFFSNPLVLNVLHSPGAGREGSCASLIRGPPTWCVFSINPLFSGFRGSMALAPEDVLDKRGSIYTMVVSRCQCEASSFQSQYSLSRLLCHPSCNETISGCKPLCSKSPWRSSNPTDFA